MYLAFVKTPLAFPRKAINLCVWYHCFLSQTSAVIKITEIFCEIHTLHPALSLRFQCPSACGLCMVPLVMKIPVV